MKSSSWSKWLQNSMMLITLASWGRLQTQLIQAKQLLLCLSKVWLDLSIYSSKATASLHWIYLRKEAEFSTSKNCFVRYYCSPRAEWATNKLSWPTTWGVKERHWVWAKLVEYEDLATASALLPRKALRIFSCKAVLSLKTILFKTILPQNSFKNFLLSSKHF